MRRTIRKFDAIERLRMELLMAMSGMPRGVSDWFIELIWFLVLKTFFESFSHSPIDSHIQKQVIFAGKHRDFCHAAPDDRVEEDILKYAVAAEITKPECFKRSFKELYAEKKVCCKLLPLKFEML